MVMGTAIMEQSVPQIQISSLTTSLQRMTTTAMVIPTAGLPLTTGPMHLVWCSMGVQMCTGLRSILCPVVRTATETAGPTRTTISHLIPHSSSTMMATGLATMLLETTPMNVHSNSVLRTVQTAQAVHWSILMIPTVMAFTTTSILVLKHRCLKLWMRMAVPIPNSMMMKMVFRMQTTYALKQTKMMTSIQAAAVMINSSKTVMGMVSSTSMTFVQILRLKLTLMVAMKINVIQTVMG